MSSGLALLVGDQLMCEDFVGHPLPTNLHPQELVKKCELIMCTVMNKAIYSQNYIPTNQFYIGLICTKVISPTS